MSSVYALGDPRTNKIHYVGVTQDVRRRYAEHISRPHDNKKKKVWIEELKEVGMLPTLLILEETDTDHAHDREIYWIQHYLSLGMPLVNVMDINPQMQELPNNSAAYRLLVKEVAKQKKVSMYKLHYRTEIALSRIKRIFHDPYTEVKLSTLARLAEALDVPMSALFDEIRERKP